MSELSSARRMEILTAARICFLDRGFVRTTISDIIALSGGSRATVYEAFESKVGLFAALVSATLEQMELPAIPDGEPAEVLRKAGTNYLEQLLDPDALGLYRVVLGESAHVRQLGQAIFRVGPEGAAAQLADRLRGWIRDGTMAIDNPDRAAKLFLAMAEGDLHRGAVMWNRAPSDEDVASHVEAAVTLFLDGARLR